MTTFHEIKRACRESAGAVLSEAKTLADEAFKLLPFNRKLILSGVAVGMAAGCSAWLLDALIRLFESFGTDHLAALPWAVKALATVLLPTLGGLIAGRLVHVHFPEAKGLGLYEVIHAIRERKGEVHPSVIVGKSLASAATIGLGGSAGQEGPIIHIGAAAGAWIGEKLRLSHQDWRTFAAGGAVGGLAAAFSIPLSGVFFTLEVILKDFASEAFAAVVIASVTATFVARLLLRREAFFPPLSYHAEGVLDFLRFGLLGLACAPMGRLYRGSLKAAEKLFHSFHPVAEWLRPALGGALVGLLAIAYPRVLGTGHETIDLALAGQLAGWTALALAFAKLFATSLTLGSGAPGGSLMPALFVGAMTGAAFARGLSLVPGFPQADGALAAVGMACLFTSVFEAPVTAIVMALELTQDYGVLLPAMFACVVTYIFSRRPSTIIHEAPSPAPAEAL